MKFKSILLTAGLAVTLGAAALAGSLSSNDVKAAKADGTTTISIEIGNNCSWNDKDGDNFCKLGVYFYTDKVGNTWGDLIELDGSTFYNYTYTTNSYTGMILVRFSSAATQGGWENVYNQTKDLSKANQVTVFDEHNSGEGADWKYWANTNYRDMTPASFTTDLSGELNIPARNDTNQLEMVATNVSVEAGDKFQISYKEGTYASLNEAVDSKLFDTTTNAGYITAKATGTFDMYFNTANHTLWVEENAAHAIIDFSEKFNDAMEEPCADENAYNYDAVSAIWATWKGKFEALTLGARAEFSTNTNSEVVQARSAYFQCVKRYKLSTWTGAPTVPSGRISVLDNNTDSTSTIVVIVSIVAALSVVGFVVFKKKHN